MCSLLFTLTSEQSHENALYGVLICYRCVDPRDNFKAFFVLKPLRALRGRNGGLPLKMSRNGLWRLLRKNVSLKSTFSVIRVILSASYIGSRFECVLYRPFLSASYIGELFFILFSKKLDLVFWVWLSVWVAPAPWQSKYHLPPWNTWSGAFRRECLRLVRLMTWHIGHNW